MRAAAGGPGTRRGRGRPAHGVRGRGDRGGEGRRWHQGADAVGHDRKRGTVVARGAPAARCDQAAGGEDEPVGDGRGAPQVHHRLVPPVGVGAAGSRPSRAAAAERRSSRGLRGRPPLQPLPATATARQSPRRTRRAVGVVRVGRSSGNGGNSGTRPASSTGAKRHARLNEPVRRAVLQAASNRLPASEIPAAAARQPQPPRRRLQCRARREAKTEDGRMKAYAAACGPRHGTRKGARDDAGEGNVGG